MEIRPHFFSPAFSVPHMFHYCSCGPSFLTLLVMFVGIVKTVSSVLKISGNKLQRKCPLPTKTARNYSYNTNDTSHTSCDIFLYTVCLLVAELYHGHEFLLSRVLATNLSLCFTVVVTYSVSQKSSPLKLFVTFSLLVNLCN